MTKTRTEAGFSMMELLVATAVLMAISGIVTQALLQLTKAQATIWNRTEMHSGIRGATELLQQEVGQAGRVGVPGQADAVPNPIQLTQAINDVAGAAPAAQASCDPSQPTLGATPVTVSSIAGLWAADGPPASYVNVTILDGPKQESVRVASMSAGPPATITACFLHPHQSLATVAVLGAFATGIVPKIGILNGSGDYVLKLYGDVNSDGNMVYVEYTCVDPVNGPNADGVTPGNLYRNVVTDILNPLTTKQPFNNSEVLLANIVDNPKLNGARVPCFTYQTQKVKVQGTDMYFVLDVAVTLTVQSQLKDPVTGTFQTETKALLNVSPRNVFNAWELASIGYTDRIQSMPGTVSKLLP